MREQAGIQEKNRYGQPFAKTWQESGHDLANAWLDERHEAGSLIATKPAADRHEAGSP
jgi:hypothetical protein